MAYLLDLGLSLLGGIFESGTPRVRYDVFDPTQSMDRAKEVSPSNMSVVYMCAKILSSTMGMIPMETTRDGRPDQDHRLYYSLRHRMNEVTNNQTIMSTIEYQRNIYGNSFVDIRGGKFDLLPIEIIDDWDFKGDGDTLRYHLNWHLETDAVKRRGAKKNAEWVSYKNILHFRGLSTNGVMGLPPVTAAMQNLKILDNASATIINFYKNRALSPMALESKIETASGAKVTIEQLEKFNQKYGGVLNSGRTMQLPPNTKLTPLQLQFADAELVNTMKFTRDEICNMYGIPSFMHGSTDTMQIDIEQQALSFKQFTIAPILAAYVSEFSHKLLSKREVIKGIGVRFDTSVLVETDLMSMANAYGKFIQNGLISPNAASKKLGFDESDAEAADYRYVQQQLIAIDHYGTMHPALVKAKELAGAGAEDKLPTKKKEGDSENDDGKEDKENQNT